MQILNKVFSFTIYNVWREGLFYYGFSYEI
jgi:hypothetical protein